ncbi:MAG TPA: hypothetical protein DCS93_02265 [Microscillaceae bacterium]|nr:hypothetical protein [Microscillaceae bacterium]
MKTQKIIYWVVTGLLSALLLMSAGMYFVNYAQASTNFTKLGYPVYIIYPLAIAKILAVVAILTKMSTKLKEWAYAGLFFEFVLAGAAHIVAKDGEVGFAIIATILLLTSYYFDSKLFGPART